MNFRKKINFVIPNIKINTMKNLLLIILSVIIYSSCSGNDPIVKDSNRIYPDSYYTKKCNWRIIHITDTTYLETKKVIRVYKDTTYKYNIEAKYVDEYCSGKSKSIPISVGNKMYNRIYIWDWYYWEEI